MKGIIMTDKPDNNKIEAYAQEMLFTGNTLNENYSKELFTEKGLFSLGWKMLSEYSNTYCIDLKGRKITLFFNTDFYYFTFVEYLHSIDEHYFSFPQHQKEDWSDFDFVFRSLTKKLDESNLHLIRKGEVEMKDVIEEFGNLKYQYYSLGKILVGVQQTYSLGDFNPVINCRFAELNQNSLERIPIDILHPGYSILKETDKTGYEYCVPRLR